MTKNRCEFDDEEIAGRPEKSDLRVLKGLGSTPRFPERLESIKLDLRNGNMGHSMGVYILSRVMHREAERQVRTFPWTAR